MRLVFVRVMGVRPAHLSTCPNAPFKTPGLAPETRVCFGREDTEMSGVGSTLGRARNPPHAPLQRKACGIGRRRLSRRSVSLPESTPAKN